MTKITYIPGEIANAAIDEHGNRKPVTRTQHIFDDVEGKSQQQINAGNSDHFENHQQQLDNKYDKSEVYNKEETYSKAQLNNMITTPNQKYVTLVAESGDSLEDIFNGVTGESDTTYRVGNWDGGANSSAGGFDVTVYSEYAFDGTDFIHLSTKTQIGEVFDISAYHATGGTLAKYANLTAALDSNNGGGVPQSLQKGGMSVKYVRTSDNKYVQYRCISDEFTVDTTKWAICSDDVLVDNPEYVYVKNDKEGKVLWAIKIDGGIYYGAGCPQQVKDYIEEKIAELSLDEYEDIVAFLDGFINKQPIFTNKKVSIIGDSISTFAGYLLEGYPSWYPHTGDRSSDVTSVNDTWWKKLIDATGSSLEVNASYSGSAATDEIGFSPRVPLLGSPNVIFIALGTNDSYRDVEIGEIDFNAEFYDLTQFAPAYIKGIKDTMATYPYARIICLAFDMGVAYQNTIKTIAEHYNLEYIYVGDISDIHPNKAEMQAVNEKIYNTYTLSGLLANKVDKEEGKSLIDEEVSESLSAVEDHEGRIEITTDAEGKIISYRDSDGVKHEEVGINVNHLELTESGMTDFQQALKEAGFRPGSGGDWSDYITNDGDSPLDLAIPRCAHLNLITDFNLVNLNKAYYDGNSEKGVNYDIPICVEFFDMQGNYFKKKAWIGGQGRSTMNRDKKNISLDLFDSDWDGDAFMVRFGDWVPQDSFHLKAYVNETFNGNGVWAYKIYDKMSKSWGVEYDYLWKRATLNMAQNTSVKAYGTTPDDNSKFEDTGAKCFPDGFPCIVYQNGEFWGVFAWQLKKHRDNYKMKKSEPKNIHLDGIINNNVWNTNGAPEWWTLEVRNPKDVVYSEAHLDSETGKYTYKYNGDLSQDDIAGNMQWSNVHEYPIDYVVEWDGKRYISLQNNNIGNDPSTESAYWSLESSTPYDSWASGTAYQQNKVIEHDGHRFINTKANNTAEPVIDSVGGINTDKAPDFKNKTGCGWINCTNTIKVKNYIIAMSRIMTKIKEKEDAYLADATAENLQDLKDTFETYFDVNNLVDYLIINDIINNADAFASNWQWLTYDGEKWWCGLYDCNISFGYGGGQYTTEDFRAPLNNSHAGGSSNYMMKYIKDYYNSELEARYSFLRSNKVVTAEKIYYDILLSWINAVGYVNYTKEREKWVNDVSVDNIFRLKKWVYETIQNLDALYHYNTN